MRVVRHGGRLQIALTKPRWSYENAVVIRKRGGHTKTRWSCENAVVMRKRGGVVGAVCNRPFGFPDIAVLRAIANRPYETTVVMRKRDGHTKPWWSCENVMAIRNSGGVVGAVFNRPLG